jgi:hypothetical protein
MWSAEALRQWRIPEGESCFIPLGRMRRVVYQLGLRFDGNAEASVHITNEIFDMDEFSQCRY